MEAKDDLDPELSDEIVSEEREKISEMLKKAKAKLTDLDKIAFGNSVSIYDSERKLSDKQLYAKLVYFGLVDIKQSKGLKVNFLGMDKMMYLKVKEDQVKPEDKQKILSKRTKFYDKENKILDALYFLRNLNDEQLDRAVKKLSEYSSKLIEMKESLEKGDGNTSKLVKQLLNVPYFLDKFDDSKIATYIKNYIILEKDKDSIGISEFFKLFSESKKMSVDLKEMLKMQASKRMYSKQLLYKLLGDEEKEREAAEEYKRIERSFFTETEYDLIQLERGMQDAKESELKRQEEDVRELMTKINQFESRCKDIYIPDTDTNYYVSLIRRKVAERERELVDKDAIEANKRLIAEIDAQLAKIRNEFVFYNSNETCYCLPLQMFDQELGSGFVLSISSSNGKEVCIGNKIIVSDLDPNGMYKDADIEILFEMQEHKPQEIIITRAVVKTKIIRTENSNTVLVLKDDLEEKKDCMPTFTISRKISEMVNPYDGEKVKFSDEFNYYLNLKRELRTLNLKSQFELSEKLSDIELEIKFINDKIKESLSPEKVEELQKINDDLQILKLNPFAIVDDEIDKVDTKKKKAAKKGEKEETFVIKRISGAKFSLKNTFGVSLDQTIDSSLEKKILVFLKNEQEIISKLDDALDQKEVDLEKIKNLKLKYVNSHPLSMIQMIKYMISKTDNQDILKIMSQMIETQKEIKRKTDLLIQQIETKVELPVVPELREKVKYLKFLKKREKKLEILGSVKARYEVKENFILLDGKLTVKQQQKFEAIRNSRVGSRAGVNWIIPLSHLSEVKRMWKSIDTVPVARAVIPEEPEEVVAPIGTFKNLSKDLEHSMKNLRKKDRVGAVQRKVDPALARTMDLEQVKEVEYYLGLKVENVKEKLKSFLINRIGNLALDKKLEGEEKKNYKSEYSDIIVGLLTEYNDRTVDEFLQKIGELMFFVDDICKTQFNSMSKYARNLLKFVNGRKYWTQYDVSKYSIPFERVEKYVNDVISERNIKNDIVSSVDRDFYSKETDLNTFIPQMGVVRALILNTYERKEAEAKKKEAKEMDIILREREIDEIEDRKIADRKVREKMGMSERARRRQNLIEVEERRAKLEKSKIILIEIPIEPLVFQIINDFPEFYNYFLEDSEAVMVEKQQQIDKKIDESIRQYARKTAYLIFLNVFSDAVYPDIKTKVYCDVKLPVYYVEQNIVYCFPLIELLNRKDDMNPKTGRLFDAEFLLFLSNMDADKPFIEEIPSLLNFLYEDLISLKSVDFIEDSLARDISIMSEKLSAPADDLFGSDPDSESASADVPKDSSSESDKDAPKDSSSESDEVYDDIEESSSESEEVYEDIEEPSSDSDV